MNIILCGLPMCGKTSIGKMLSEKLGWSFIDTDRLIETQKDRPCREIFIEEGELAFRKFEKEQITTLNGLSKCVIALGGGTLLDRDNVKAVQKCGTLIYLQAAADLLWTRTRERGIPAFLGFDDPEKAFYELAKKRIPHYEEAAHYTIETGQLTIDEITWQVTHLEIFSK